MAACIRAPRGQAASMETMHHSKAPSTSAHHKSIIQIYTDWGNHYLEKARSKKLLTDLQTDLVDGVLLADLIESVTNHKVPDVHRKPKTAALMVENIRACLLALERLGVNLEGVSVKELREGSLKSVLALFFALSKYKQQLKLQAEANKAKKHDDMLSRLPTPYQSPIGHGHTTSIPTPLSLRHNQSVHPVSSSPLKCPSTSSSRSTSPSHSFIPTPRSQGRTAAPEKQSIQRVSAPRNPQTPASSPYSTPVKNNSMLDKLKLFNQKDKPKQVSGSAKRTSSSSGFSSARSERSDSSTSLHSDAKSSTIEKKESSLNDLNKSHLRKKVVKAESKIVRPGRTSGGSARLQQQPSPSAPISVPSPPQVSGQALNYPGSINRGTLRHLEPPISGHGQGQRRISDQKADEGRCSPAPKRRESPQLELAQPANPPPPPAPSSHTLMDGAGHAGEALRVAGGAGGIPKSSATACVGIPKPTAVVKGYSKPTHPVAPLPPAPHPPEPLYAALEKEKSTHDPRHSQDQRNHNQLFKPEKLEVVLEKSHERQTSLEESEDGANVKPMQPLLPGYNNRAMAILPRTIPLNRSRGGAYKPLDTYPRSNTERNFAECDYGNPNVSSGYMSDGDVLHTKPCDIQDGYLSEGGTTLYRRTDARLGLNVNTGEPCAVKLSNKVDMKVGAWATMTTEQKEVAWLKKEDDDRILGEYKSYILMDAVQRKEQRRYYVGLPIIYECGTFRDTVYMTMELLGPDLLDLFIVCNYRFSLKTVIQIAVQLLRTLKYVHGCGVLHRDIKPDNCMIGRKINRTENIIHLVDFGNSRELIDRRRNAHIRPKIGQSLHGTARFASLNVHLGKEYGRRDDLESLSYMLIYFLKGTLPWQGLNANEIYDLWAIVAETKRVTPLSILCEGLPQEFLSFARYIRKLMFFDEPDYDLWIKQFMGLYQSLKYFDINEFDWTCIINSDEESD